MTFLVGGRARLLRGLYSRPCPRARLHDNAVHRRHAEPRCPRLAVAPAAGRYAHRPRSRRRRRPAAGRRASPASLIRPVEQRPPMRCRAGDVGDRAASPAWSPCRSAATGTLHIVIERGRRALALTPADVPEMTVAARALHRAVPLAAAHACAPLRRVPARPRPAPLLLRRLRRRPCAHRRGGPRRLSIAGSKNRSRAAGRRARSTPSFAGHAGTVGAGDGLPPRPAGRGPALRRLRLADRVPAGAPAGDRSRPRAS